MFKNRSFQVKMVKDADASSTPIPNVTIDLEKIRPIFEKYVRNAAIGGVLVYAAIKTIDTASEVVINMTNPANR